MLSTDYTPLIFPCLSLTLQLSPHTFLTGITFNITGKMEENKLIKGNLTWLLW